ncbi:hypothetical protein [Rufibacter psychrotolerans]|uniref:hypothetical protein n=1 Tax=Rufibacter psychrotolerans TaxID=2812556 RepID=UPI00196891EF|nr:hypothetical protein [Rufibacter sp. SYSU D00308]
MTQDRMCPQCGDVFRGRVDKRFCSDQCRACYNNASKRENTGEQFIHRVNTILRRNRAILKKASPLGKTTLRRQVLEMAGFDFNYFTSVYRSQKGSTYTFCYDYGYLLLPEEKVLIVNFQPYMQASP